MLENAQIAEIARDAVISHLRQASLERIVTADTTDSTGADAVLITLVLTPKAVDELTGDDALDVLVEVKTRLAAAGEERSAILEYATEQELRAEDA